MQKFQADVSSLNMLNGDALYILWNDIHFGSNIFIFKTSFFEYDSCYQD